MKNKYRSYTQNYTQKGNIVVKFVDDDNSNSNLASDSNVVNNKDMVLNNDGAFVHLKKLTITTPDNNNNTKNNNGSVRNNNNNHNNKLYRNIIYDGSEEEIIHISPINSNLYNTPGRAGAIALGKNKNTRRRKMKKIIIQDGKYSLGYGL